MVRKSFFFLMAAALLLSAIPARAHFVWVAVQNDSAGQPQAHVWFSEIAEADDEKLIDKIAQTKVSARSIGKEAVLLELQKQLKDGGGAWVGSVPAGASGALSASCHYGVLDKRGQVFLLEYHAKFLDAGHPGFKALSRDESLPLDVVPGAVADNRRTLTVLYRGNPAAGSEIVAYDPEGAEETLKTDEKGEVTLAGNKPGLYSIRAKWEVAEAGKEKDKEYKKVVHYCTLALKVPGDSKAAGGASAAKDDEAPLVMRRARLARAAWENFPGFEAELKLFAEGGEQEGKITVSAGGEVELSGIKLKGEKPILTTLRSLVSHRLGRGSDDDAVSFVEEPSGHPLGRLIRFDDDSAMGSHYRIKDDVIREVNRKNESGKFTISVFEVRRNPEGKYLPGVYSVNFWNKDGTLRSNTTVVESWTRLESFDLPLTHDSVTAAAGEQRNVRMEFSAHKLLQKAAAK